MGFLYFFALTAEEGFLISLAILWNSAFKWVYFLFSFAFASLLFTAICKAFSDNHFAFLVVITTLDLPLNHVIHKHFYLFLGSLPQSGPSDLLIHQHGEKTLSSLSRVSGSSISLHFPCLAVSIHEHNLSALFYIQNIQCPYLVLLTVLPCKRQKNHRFKIFRRVV